PLDFFSFAFIGVASQLIQPTGKSFLPHLHRSFRDGDLFSRNRAGSGHERGDQWNRTEARLEFAVFIQELRAPIAIMLQDLLKFPATGNQDDAFGEFISGTESFRVPRPHFTEHATPMRLAKDLNHQLEMTAHDAHSLFETRLG